MSEFGESVALEIALTFILALGALVVFFVLLLWLSDRKPKQKKINRQQKDRVCPCK